MPTPQTKTDDTRQPFAQTRRGTVLFADLRGYTSLAERLEPFTVVALLEEFFAVGARLIASRGGTVFDLAGDTLVAAFGLAESPAASAQHALDAGRLIVAEFGAVAIRWERNFGVTVGVGVGLHVGDFADIELGPVPIRRRTLIGDTVNVAARLCQRARAGEVLFSAGVVAPLDPHSLEDVIPLPQFPLRGRRSPVRIFCVPARERIMLDPAFAAGLAEQLTH